MGWHYVGVCLSCPFLTFIERDFGKAISLHFASKVLHACGKHHSPPDYVLSLRIHSIEQMVCVLRDRVTNERAGSVGTSCEAAAATESPASDTLRHRSSPPFVSSSECMIGQTPVIPVDFHSSCVAKGFFGRLKQVWSGVLERTEVELHPQSPQLGRKEFLTFGRVLHAL